MTQTLVAADVYDRLQTVMASDPDGFCELYRDYLADARQTLSHLRVLCEEKSADDLRFKAHYLKSSSLVLGIRPVAELCAELESAAKVPDLAEAWKSLHKLAELLNLVQVELERKLGPQVIPVAA